MSYYSLDDRIAPIHPYSTEIVNPLSNWRLKFTQRIPCHKRRLKWIDIFTLAVYNKTLFISRLIIGVSVTIFGHRTTIRRILLSHLRRCLYCIPKSLPKVNTNMVSDQCLPQMQITLPG